MEDKKSTYTKTIEVNGKRKSVTCKQVENGYVITICTSDYSGDKSEYSEKTYISKKNPFPQESEDDEDEMNLPDLNSISNSLNF